MDDLANLRRQLKAGGYSPIPCQGKKPPMDGWPEKIVTNDDEIALWGKLYQYATNTGILTKFVPAFDIDIFNPDAAKAVEDLVRARNEDFGIILTRFGNVPKRAILFQTDAPFKKFVTNVIAPDGSSGQKIELLADGQQIIVHGIHPDTNRPYGWHGGSPFEIPRADLPHIHERDARGLVADAIDLVVKEFGYAVAPSAASPHDKPNGTVPWGNLIGAIHAGHDLHDNTLILAAR
jgi:hypothetical protein